LELQNDLARYIAIRISGLIETTVRDCYDEYTQEKASPDIHRYVSRKLKRFQNPKIDDVIKLAGDFQENWAKELEEVDMEISEAVGSIVSTRNNAAHGGDQNITLTKVEQHYRNVLKFLNQVQRQCSVTRLE
jgi:phosphodiesterase/alkaline phosphatase D-like protein